jgi:hypothetical protein
MSNQNSNKAAKNTQQAAKLLATEKFIEKARTDIGVLRGKRPPENLTNNNVSISERISKRKGVILFSF